jgi:hypothetical protein
MNRQPNSSYVYRLCDDVILLSREDRKTTFKKKVEKTKSTKSYMKVTIMVFRWGSIRWIFSPFFFFSNSIEVTPRYLSSLLGFISSLIRFVLDFMVLIESLQVLFVFELVLIKSFEMTLVDFLYSRSSLVHSFLFIEFMYRKSKRAVPMTL